MNKRMSSRSSRSLTKKRRMDQQQVIQSSDKGLCSDGSSASVSSIPDGGEPRPTDNYRVILARKGYMVHETLGSGSYSKVKRASNIFEDGDNVAIKIIDRLKAPKDYQERFLPRELELWPKLKHPNLVSLQEVFHDGRRVYMVTDYASKGDVLKYIQEKGAVGESQAVQWMYEICDAVKFLHSLNIAHRDLKLENLLITGENNIKVADFGFICKDAGISLSSTYCGSKSYAAPEILVGRPYNAKRSDVWALGVVLYIIITGKMPFDESKGTRHILREQESLKLYWPKNIRYSEPVQNLVVNMFTWAYEKRPDIHSVLMHHWFRHVTRNAEMQHELAISPMSPTQRFKNTV